MIAWRRAAMGLDGAARAHLRGAAPHTASVAHALVERLYEHLRALPATRALLTSDELVARLKAQLRASIAPRAGAARQERRSAIPLSEAIVDPRGDALPLEADGAGEALADDADDGALADVADKVQAGPGIKTAENVEAVVGQLRERLRLRLL